MDPGERGAGGRIGKSKETERRKKMAKLFAKLFLNKYFITKTQTQMYYIQGSSFP